MKPSVRRTLLVLQAMVLVTMACICSCNLSRLAEWIEGAATQAVEVEQVVADIATVAAEQQATYEARDERAYGQRCPLGTDYVEVPPGVTNLNLRSGPGTGYRSMGYVAAGQCYPISEQRDTWIRIDTSLGQGWVSRQYVSVPTVSREAETGGESNVAPSSGNAFIDAAIAPAQAAEMETGVPSSVTIAQAILESAYGTRHIGDANNYFGIKATTRSDGSVDVGNIAVGWVEARTREWNGTTYVDVIAKFRKYNSMADSFRDHAAFFIENPRYAEAMRHTSDPDEFARQIARAGYATDPNYASTLIGLMTEYNLYQYDRVR